MPIKLIAVDMDGTFLNNQQDYDRRWFQELYPQLQAQGIKFVVASGNQYYQLRSFFPEIASQLAFVAENGAYVVEAEEEVFCGELAAETIQEVLAELANYAEVHTLICGKNSAYVQDGEDPTFIQHASRYYHRLTTVANLRDLPEDTLFKFALSTTVANVEPLIASLSAKFAGRITPVSSGHGDVDLIIPGIHKANGLKRLQAHWQIADEEVAAFGDSGNDLEMLQHAGFSYAMANAQPAVKASAKTIIASNQEQGVLQQIEKILAETNQEHIPS
ncbi:Cof-type HAD-IIB family hydrolase [Enterococcus diestrammenae]|uniref:FMN hydrolase/5-amino-6-(5-phospho-D-ribitylamino)uracil phosphatase n=1 Tax=Enterococcus diestrammenae TaxID=1155073 RepID=A0ABV0EZL6_9ENTE|nr:Cof-type HAD-IIB family hydrolase [Enterococcus diestrammenae]KAF1294977.1 sugar-phosphatase [Enterococcus diestrammenae]